ncbi:MAG: prenyltransferase, partial [Deltaproteobacteria bacterium]|nr:prenyltransferase [Deltaproteobacteria bacterium]
LDQTLKRQRGFLNEPVLGAGLRPVRLWWIAARPFSFPASSMPVLLGTTAAVSLGGATFKPLLFLAALIGVLLLHAGANLLADVRDFAKGLDREILPVSGGVVRGLITPTQALQAGAVCFVLGSALGFYLAFNVSLSILAIGAAGVAAGFFYTTAPFALKYRALGDAAIFLSFGLLGSLGAWTVQTGEVSWIPVILALPTALMIVAIVHANNWRDIRNDTRHGCKTVASILGPRGCRAYFTTLICTPYLLITVFVLNSWLAPNSVKLPPSALIVFLSLPLALTLLKRTPHTNSSNTLTMLDGNTAKLNLFFGTLYVAALILDSVFFKTA